MGPAISASLFHRMGRRSLSRVILRNGVSDVYVVPMSGGEPQRRTNWNSRIGNVIWAPDGRDLIYNVGSGYPLSLWRIPARGSQVERGQPVLLPTNAHSPTISTPAPGQPARLAFLTIQADINLRLIDLEAPHSGAAFESVQALFDSTVVEYPGSFSPDGARIAFTSERTGEDAAGGAAQLWVARRDNTGLRQLTKLDSPEVRAPSWSPDGRRIVFEASIAGNSDIFVIDADGGEPKRLTVEASIDRLPNWSQDGRTDFFQLRSIRAAGGLEDGVRWRRGAASHAERWFRTHPVLRWRIDLLPSAGCWLPRETETDSG